MTIQFGNFPAKVTSDLTQPSIDPRDWRVPVDMTIQSIGYALDELQTYLDGQGREADYLSELDNQAVLNSRLVKLTLICSILRERARLLQAAE